MKTVNLRLSKQLKESGYIQKTSFYWMKIEYPEKGFIWELRQKGIDLITKDAIASPLLEEILSQMPIGTDISKEKNRYACVLYIHNTLKIGKTSMDACAKMWLYLKKEKLI